MTKPLVDSEDCPLYDKKNNKQLLHRAKMTEPVYDMYKTEDGSSRIISLLEEHREWCNEHCRGLYRCYYGVAYFQFKKDMVFFALNWLE